MQQDVKRRTAEATSLFGPRVTIDFVSFGLAPEVAEWLAPQMTRFARLADRATDALCASGFHREAGAAHAPTPHEAAIALAVALGHQLAGFAEAAPREDLRLICDAVLRAQIHGELEARHRLARSATLPTGGV